MSVLPSTDPSLSGGSARFLDCELDLLRTSMSMEERILWLWTQTVGDNDTIRDLQLNYTVLFLATADAALDRHTLVYNLSEAGLHSVHCSNVASWDPH